MILVIFFREGFSQRFAVATLLEAQQRVSLMLLAGCLDLTAVVVDESREIVAYYDYGWTEVYRS